MNAGQLACRTGVSKLWGGVWAGARANFFTATGEQSGLECARGGGPGARLADAGSAEQGPRPDGLKRASAAESGGPLSPPGAPQRSLPRRPARGEPPLFALYGPSPQAHGPGSASPLVLLCSLYSLCWLCSTGSALLAVRHHPLLSVVASGRLLVGGVHRAGDLRGRGGGQL